MINRRVIFLLASVFLALLLVFFTDLRLVECLAIGMFLLSFLDLVDKFGRKIIVLELFTAMAILQWLIAPILFYHIYTFNNYLARLWVKFMPVPHEDYYSYAFTGTALMLAGFHFPLSKYIPKTDKAEITQYHALIPYFIRQNRQHIIWTMFAIGAVASFLEGFAPMALRNVFFMLGMLIYVGYAYLFLSDMPYKRLATAIILSYVGLRALSTGMFGESFYIVIFTIMVILPKFKLRFSLKLASAVVLFTFAIILQSIKAEYRALAWSQGSATTSDFVRLLGQGAKSYQQLLNADNFFFIAVRFNQGWHIATTMDKVPRSYPFAHGETILNSVLATLIPRFLWNDKPMSGGKANLRRFWGYESGNTSMNLSPLGEAYANFGRFGGILFMFIFGLALNLAVTMVNNWTSRRPTIICWYPLIFISFVAVETDVLSVFNSVFKGIIFVSAVMMLVRVIYVKSI